MSKELPEPTGESPTPPVDSVEGELVPEFAIPELELNPSGPPPTDAEYEPFTPDRDSLSGDSVDAVDPEPTPEPAVAEPESVSDPLPLTVDSHPVAEEPAPPPADTTSEELLAAKWYTTGFLIVIGILSIVAFVVMILLAVRMYGVVMN